MMTLLASRKAAEDDTVELWLGYDAGAWTLRSVLKVGRLRMTEIDISPAAMDALVAAWPKFKAEVGGEVQ